MMTLTIYLDMQGSSSIVLVRLQLKEGLTGSDPEPIMVSIFIHMEISAKAVHQLVIIITLLKTTTEDVILSKDMKEILETYMLAIMELQLLVLMCPTFNYKEIIQ
jgi:hypothetical protein